MTNDRSRATGRVEQQVLALYSVHAQPLRAFALGRAGRFS
jgi:hypothetical protein